MKNSNLFKKFAAIVLSVMMVLPAFAMPTFAAARTSFEVKGLKPGVKATAYRIVVMNDDDSTNVVLPGSIQDVEKPTADEIMALYARKAELSNTATAGVKVIGPVTVAENATVASFTGVEPGLYMVTFEATKDAETIYNPVIVGINNDSTKDALTNGAIGVDGKFNTTGTDAYAKSSEIPFDKVVERSDQGGRQGNSESNVGNGSTEGDEALTGLDPAGNRGDTAGTTGNGGQKVGDKVWFRINTKIPAYADNFFNKTVDDTTGAVTYTDTNTFKNPQFKVYDTLSAGLDLQSTTIEVYVNGVAQANKVTAAADTFELKLDDTTKDFIITFKPAFIDAHPGENVEIRYQAQINGNHGVNYNGETNTAQIDYTRNPGEDSQKSEEKTTYHYTFTINGAVNGDGSDENREVIKVGTDENGNQVFEETKWNQPDQKGWKPLAGAVFELYKADTSNEDTTKANNAWVKTGNAVKTTDPTGDDGILRGLDQLDAGKYVLIEKTAPNGYAKNDIPIAIEIQSTLDNLGRMTNYKVFVNSIKVGDYSKSYGENDKPTAGGRVASIGTLKYENQKAANDSRVTTYTKDDGTVVNWTADNDGQAADIRNSKTGTLPSTGGIGTVIFTIGGIAIMALALVLLFGGKKKKEQNN